MVVSSGQAEATLLFENEKTKVVRWFFKKLGDSTGWHKHQFDYMVLPLFTGSLKVEAKEKSSIMNLTLGSPYFRKAGIEHDVINANDFSCAFIEVEFL